jgi:hypothetical protein
MLYLLATVLLLWHNHRHFVALLRQEQMASLTLFVVGYLLCYLLLYAWYTRIAYGNRFVLALFLPMLFCCVRLAAYAQQRGLPLALWRWSMPTSAFSAFVALWLIIYLLTVYPNQICSMYGGF